MQNIEHIGIAVSNLAASVPLFEKLLNTNCYKTEFVETEKVNTAFFKTGETKVEMVEATEENSPVGKFLAKGGSGIHHIAFAVQDIEAEMKRLSEAGFRLLNEIPRPGADNKLVCFLHPKDTKGVLIKLCQERP